MKPRYNYLLQLIVLFGWNVFTANSSFAQVTSDITSNTTWTAAESPVVVPNTISISQGATLTIEPGVTVQMGNGASLLVFGGLVSAGTELERILFTSGEASPAPGDWGSIEFRNNTDAGSVFDYVTVEYGSGADRSGMVFYTTGAFAVGISNAIFRNSAVHGINLRASSPVITDSEFYNNNSFGVFTDLSLNFTVTNSSIYDNTEGGIRVPINSAPTISNNTIEANGIGVLIDNGGQPTLTNNQILDNSVGIQIIEVGASKPVITDNTISGNTDWGIQNLAENELVAKFNFWGSSLGPTVGTNPSGNGDRVTVNNVDYTPWRFGATDLPVVEVNANINSNTTWQSGTVYHILNSISVLNAITLTVEPGTVVKFAGGANLTINGTLLANGTETDLIFFTSEKDDAAGGDSNGDGDSSLPTPGDWGSININNSGSQISNAIIRFGFGNGALNLSHQTALSDVSSSNNGSDGIYSTVSQTGWTNVSAVDNNRYGIFINQGSLEISGGNTSFNGIYGIYVANSTTPYTMQIADVTSNFNGQFGIYLTGNSSSSNQIRFESLTNSTVSFNGSDGVRVLQSPGGITISGNTFEGNAGHGVNLNHSGGRETVVFQDNILKGNDETGVLSSQARFIDNTFEGNRFTIGAWERLGHRYTDELGVDGNSFTGNTFNNALALYGANLRDTLSATFPEAIDSKTYLLAASGNANGANDELVIEPGVTVKTSGELASIFSPFTLLGKLTAVGTETEPIVFTSLQDHDFGGNVNVASDTVSAAPGDWSGLSLRLGGTAQSKLKHVTIRYGRTNLTLGSNNTNATYTYENTFEDLWIDQGSFDGIVQRGTSTVFDRLKLTNNRTNGMALSPISGGFVTRSVIRNSEITGNGQSVNNAGLAAGSSGSNGSAFTEISNSIIENNTNGVIMNRAPLPVTLLGNQIRNNDTHGVRFNSDLSRADNAFVGNIISGNTETGILSSQARFIDNTFEENRFSIGVWESLGHRYTDELGVDGNSFTGNTFNNALALYGANLRDTLSATFPEAIDSKTYLLASSGSSNGADDELIIEPGVTVKTSSIFTSPTSIFTLLGKLTAVGTESEPIVFTSLRDHDFGGNVNLESDTVSAAPGDWGGLSLRMDGTAESTLKHVTIRYGRTNLTLGSVNTNATYTYENTFEDLWIDQGSFDGILQRGTSTIFDRLKLTNNRNNGMALNAISGGFVTRSIIRNSEITGNGQSVNNAGLAANSSGSNGSAFTEISNSIIENNTNGLTMNRAPLPVVIQSSTFGNNSRDGLFANLEEVESDTVLTISGNTFRQNARAGLISSRALIEDNNFEENRISIAVAGELSKTGTSNELGNLYDGNIFLNNELEDVIGIYSDFGITPRGSLGFTNPDAYLNPVFVNLQSNTIINSGDELRIAPGTVIKFGAESTFESYSISGVLHAVGTVDEKIVFTSFKDDTYNGDTNGDGVETVPQRSDWSGLRLQGTSASSSLLKHAIVRYAETNISLTNGNEAVIDSSFVSNAATGISVGNNSKPTIRNSDIHTNNTGISVVSNADDPNIHLNNFYGNETAALSVFRSVTAIDNYWGDSTGPFVDQGPDQNIDGQGDRITMSGSNTVTYRPFLTDRTGILLGDVSENGAISGFDAALTLQSVVDLVELSPTQIAAADVSGDGTVTAMDASFILQFVVGSISGFPGAGKSPQLSPEDLFTIETVLEENYYDVMISSLGQIPVSAAELSIDFNSSQISHVEMISTSETQEWTTLHNKTDGNLKAAVAGANYITEEADVLNIRFYFADEFEGGVPENLEIVSFRLNETDFSDHAGSLFTSLNEELVVPKEFVLDQNYPNPFNPSTVLRYSLPVSGEVSLDVYNSIGQKVATLVNSELQTSGNYSQSWNASNLASGVYFYRISVKGENGQSFTDVKKMMLIK